MQTLTPVETAVHPPVAGAAAPVLPALRWDPRLYQIATLSGLLGYGVFWLDLEVQTRTAVAIIVTALVTQLVFAPPSSALVARLLATGSVWVSPGQWGSGLVFAFLLASAGGLVVNRAARADVTLAFLASWASLLVARSLWLGEPLAIPLHRLENGALVLFAFFMISDPRTTPDSRAGRLLFAALVALAAYAVQFTLFRT